MPRARGERTTVAIRATSSSSSSAQSAPGAEEAVEAVAAALVIASLTGRHLAQKKPSGKGSLRQPARSPHPTRISIRARLLQQQREQKQQREVQLTVEATLARRTKRAVGLAGLIATGEHTKAAATVSKQVEQYGSSRGRSQLYRDAQKAAQGTELRASAGRPKKISNSAIVALDAKVNERCQQRENLDLAVCKGLLKGAIKELGEWDNSKPPAERTLENAVRAALKKGKTRQKDEARIRSENSLRCFVAQTALWIALHKPVGDKQLNGKCMLTFDEVATLVKFAPALKQQFTSKQFQSPAGLPHAVTKRSSELGVGVQCCVAMTPEGSVPPIVFFVKGFKKQWDGRVFFKLPGVGNNVADTRQYAWLAVGENKRVRCTH